MSPAVDDLNKTEKTIRHTLDGFSYVLVPAPLYQEKDKEKYLDFLGLTDDKGVVCVDYIEIADIYNVYRAESENKVARHATSVLLENIIKENTERTDDARVYLNVKDQRFEMFILEGAKLLLYNTFRFKTKEDFLYFLLFSMEQLHLETETTPVYFLGMIEKDSQIVELVSRYIRDVRFKKRTTMRIIRGRHQRRQIVAPDNLPTRPTTDMAKESLFNILENQIDLEETTALDLFAGTGNISYELVSRGCPHVTAVDENNNCVRFIRETANKLNMNELSVVKSDVFRFLPMHKAKYDLIFADPPYDCQHYDVLVNLIFENELLNEDGIFVLEHDRTVDFSEHPHYYDHRKYGKVNFTFFSQKAKEE